MKMTHRQLRRVIREELISEVTLSTTASREFEIVKSYLSKFCAWSKQYTSDTKSVEKAIGSVTSGLQSIEAQQQELGIAPDRERAEGDFSIEDIARIIPSSVKNLNSMCSMIEALKDSLLSTLVDDLEKAGLPEIDARSKKIINNWIHVAVNPALESLNMYDLQDKAEDIAFRKSAASTASKILGDPVTFIKEYALFTEGLLAIFEAVGTLLVNTQSFGEALRRINPNIKIPWDEEAYKQSEKTMKNVLKLSKSARSLMGVLN